MFSEWLCDGDFIICPRIDFEVGVRVMGGLLSLGYSIGFHVHRNSHIIRCAHGVVISLDKVSSLPLPYVQIKGSDRYSVFVYSLYAPRCDVTISEMRSAP